MSKLMPVFTMVVSAAICSACYQIPINQGNRIEQTAVERLKVGMTREQVRYLMGAPVLQEPFDQSRWNYVSRYKTKAGDYKDRTIILFFKGDILNRITGDLTAPEQTADEEEASAP
ncbi:MAG TPA: outer membrane protein assembly factor BamE [Gammaproteobacteria bacterium]